MAIENAEMDPPGRLVLMMLLGRCDFGTVHIPPKFAPTYSELARITGLAPSTLYEWMTALTDAGWISKVEFPGKAKAGFEIAVGDQKVCRSAVRAARKPRPKKVTADAAEPVSAPSTTAEVIDPAYRSAIHDPGPAALPDVSPGDTKRIAERYADVSPGDTGQLALLIQDSPTESLTLTALTSSSSAKPRKAAKRKPKKSDETDEESKLLNKLTKIYTDLIPMAQFFAVRTAVKAAVGSKKYATEEIEKALAALAAAHKPCSHNTLIYEIGNQKGGHVNPPYRGRDDHKVHGTHELDYSTDI